VVMPEEADEGFGTQSLRSSTQTEHQFRSSSQSEHPYYGRVGHYGPGEGDATQAPGQQYYSRVHYSQESGRGEDLEEEEGWEDEDGDGEEEMEEQELDEEDEIDEEEDTDTTAVRIEVFLYARPYYGMAWIVCLFVRSIFACPGHNF
jgi:hypothetical protein